MKIYSKFIMMLTAIIFFGSAAQSQKIPKITKPLADKIEVLNSSDEISVWIFFTGKGDDLEAKRLAVRNELPNNSLKRRKKILKNDKLVTYYDIPIKKSYFENVQPFISKLRHKSRWLNAISAEVKVDQMTEIANLPFVKKLDIVRKGKSIKREGLDVKLNPIKNNEKNTFYDLDYGPSITQNEQINVPLLHDMGFSGNGVVICVMDAGFNNLEHQVFNNLDTLGSWDFVNDDPNVDDEGDMGTGDHGTMTLSTIGGFYEGELIGPAYGASYVLAKTENTDSETPIEEDHWVAAMEWAELNYGPDITSTSLGYRDFDDGSGYSNDDMDGNTAVITIGADIAAGLGILVVNSAGNSGPGATTIGAPADGDSVLAIGAVDGSGSLASFSSWGPTADNRIKPEVCAMGVGVTVAETYGNYYGSANGTSFSCPLTAGAAAVLLEMVPDATNMEIFEALKTTANNANNPNNQYGWGILDAYEAYNYLVLPKIEHDALQDTEDLDGPYTVDAEVSSFYNLIAGSPSLYYRIDGGTWQTIAMTETAGDIYTAEIPGTGNETNYDYYIEAENSIASVTMPSNAPDEYFSFFAGMDNIPPSIEHNLIAEYYVNLWGTCVVNATITDNLGINPEDVYVEWKLNGTEMNNFPLVNQGNNIFTGQFPEPQVEIDDQVEYKIYAADLSTNSNHAYFPETGYQSFNITESISFEENAFSHDWELEGAADWFITSQYSYDGDYSAQSGDVDDSQSSTIIISFEGAEAGEVSFSTKVSSEEGWDFFRFYIDDQQLGEWSGELNWSEETYDVSAGEHTLKWTYIKDGYVTSGDDCAWIDDITLPENVNNVSVKHLIAGKKMKIYPNPASTHITVALEDKLQNTFIVSLFDATGRKVLTQKANSNILNLDISTLDNGLYFIGVENNDYEKVQKVIINR